MRLIAIQIDDNERPVLCRTDDYTKFYWGVSGPSWFTARKTRVLKDYGEVGGTLAIDLSEEEEAALATLEIAFILDFPLEPKLGDDEGWIAPDGRFYPCPDGSHTTTAWTLYVMTHREACDTARDALMSAGWLEVHQDRVLVNFKGDGPVPATPEQLATLYDLLALKADEVKRKQFGAAIRQFEDSDFVSTGSHAD
jgi:hypothetical protein